MTGIGGYDLASASDLAVAFDYDHSGKLDHLVLYRPGFGVVFIVKNNDDGTFSHVYAANPGGIGGFDLKSSVDQVVAFDYDHSGKLDHLVLYRPGFGVVFIVKNNDDGTFSQVYDANPGGIGGFDLKSSVDQVIAFDYDHSGKLDHLVLYRPGFGVVFIVKNNDDGTFSHVYAANPGGIGGFDLKSSVDQVVAFDYDHSWKLDHLVLYRPGFGVVFIVKNNDDGTFSQVYDANPGGIGGFDLASPADRIVAFDYDHSGKLDHLVLYRPGQGVIFIIKNDDNGTFSQVYAANPGGIGGYDLKSPADRIVAFDYEHSGKSDYLVLYRPGGGTLFILKNTGGTFTPVYEGVPPAPTPLPTVPYCVQVFAFDDDDDPEFVGQLTIQATSDADAEAQSDGVVAELGGDFGEVTKNACGPIGAGFLPKPKLVARVGKPRRSAKR